MGDTLLSNVGGKIADQVIVQLYAPAYVFWAGGIALYLRAHWTSLKPVVTTLPESNMIVLAAGWALLVAASAAIGQRFEPGAVRLLEGYHWPERLKKWRCQRFTKRYTDAVSVFQSLAPKIDHNTATPAEREQYVDTDLQLHRLPPNPDDIMPTELGNILRAAERRVEAKYGLDPRICWARLWTLISKDAREDLSDSRAALDIGARSFLWGGLFAVWTIWSWWAILVAVAAVLASYAWMIQAADEYGELLESAYDVYRFALYKSLCLRLPADSAEEPEMGRLLTRFLWRGDVPAIFTKPSP
jgi:hypothetical protein